MEDYDTGYVDGVRDTDTRKNVIISWIIIAIAVAAMFGFISFPAAAAECGKHEKVIQFLGAKYKEQRTAVGLVSNRGVMEFFVSEKTGTWTVLLTNTKGISCIVAAGQSFERSKPMAKTDPES